MNKSNERNDAILITAVAGCVIAGAAALALFGGLAAEREARDAGKVEPTAVRAALHDRSGNGPTLASAPVPEEPELGTVDVPASIGPDVPEDVEPTCQPAAGESWVAAGLRMWNSRQYELASDCFATADRDTPDRAWIVYMHGLSLWKGGRLDEAEEALSRAVDIDPTCTRCAINLARVRNDASRHVDALDAARAAIASDPSSADARYLEGRSLYNLGRVDEALASLHEAVDLDPSHGHAHNLIGLTLLQADLEHEARAPLETARDLLPGVAYVHNNLGLVYERLGRSDLAVVEFRAAVDLDAGAGPAATHLARIDPDGAVEASVLLAAAEVPEIESSAAGTTVIDAEQIAVAAIDPTQVEDPDGNVPDAGTETP